MSLPTPHDARALRVDLLLPASQMQFGPFSMDPFKMLLGFSIADLVASLMRAPQAKRLVGDKLHDVYPLGIPEGEGLSVPIRSLGGEIGFRNLQGVLVVTVPAPLVNEVSKRLQPSIQRGDVLGPRFPPITDGNSVGEYAVKWKAGVRVAIPIPSLGELAFEAAP